MWWWCSVTKLCPTLEPHGWQHSRLPCPSLSPWVCSNSCPLSWWCHPTSSSSVVPFSSCPQSFPASGSLPVSQLFTSGDQSIGVLALASVFLMNNSGLIFCEIDWFDLLAVQVTLKSLLHQFFGTRPSLWSNSHSHAWLLENYMDLYQQSDVSSFLKAYACNTGDLGSIPGQGRSPGEGNGNLLQYCCLGNPMDGGAWWATVHGVAKSRTRLSDFTSLVLS